MLLLAALVTTTAAILIIRMTIGYLWRPLRPQKRHPSFWRTIIRAAFTVAARRVRSRGQRPTFRP